MVEKEAVKEREAESKVDLYDEELKLHKENLEKARKGKRIIKGNKLPWQVAKQGILRFYHTEPQNNWGLGLETLRLFVHEIRTHSGRHKHQGGFCLFVLVGKGYTVVDGTRCDWSEGDLILLPFKKGGVEHQHYNIDSKPSRWLAFSSIPLGQMTGFIIEQKEKYTGFKG